MKILVVDDEKLLVKGITFNLENEGYEVTAAYDGEAAVELAKKESFDLIILDLMMPVLSGTEACMKIREFSDVPIIMLTARSEDADKLMGFACGADDYVTKPFNILELKARVQALLRRTARSRRTSVLTGQDLTLNCDTRDVTKNGKPLELTYKEFELLKLLMENSDRVMTRSELLNLVWGIDFEGETRTLDMHVRTLRQKLGDDAENPRYIRTVRGVGYRFYCG